MECWSLTLGFTARIEAVAPKPISFRYWLSRVVNEQFANWRLHTVRPPLDHTVRRDRLRGVSSARRPKPHRLEHAEKWHSNVSCLWTIPGRGDVIAGFLHGEHFARTDVKAKHAHVFIIPARGGVADLARRNGHPRRVRMAIGQALWRSLVASDHFARVPAERTARHGSVPFPLFCFTQERTHDHGTGFARLATVQPCSAVSPHEAEHGKQPTRRELPQRRVRPIATATQLHRTSHSRLI